MISQEQITALVKAEVMTMLSEMGLIKDQISARECWGICGRRRFEALVAAGQIIDDIGGKGAVAPQISVARDHHAHQFAKIQLAAP